MGQRIGQARVTEPVPQRGQSGRYHPLIGLGQFAGALGAEQQARAD
jgi:hypothetical protein